MTVPSVRIDGPTNPLRPAQYFSALAKLVTLIPLPVIDDIVSVVLRAYHQQRTVFLYGNGGSAALASHSACDLGKGTAHKDSRRLKVVSLTDNIPLITAWANDSAYEFIFVEQLRNFLQPGDISFAISASGNSPNVVNALQFSREVGATTVGITGFSGGRMLNLCDVCLVVPSNNMQLIEDLHLSVSHVVFLAVGQHIAEFTRSRAAAVNSL